MYSCIICAFLFHAEDAIDLMGAPAKLDEVLVQSKQHHSSLKVSGDYPSPFMSLLESWSKGVTFGGSKWQGAVTNWFK